jgi:peroxiredoxin
MPDLVKVASDPDTDATFLGINVRDPSLANAQSFVRTFDVPFPSLYDPDGNALLAFGGVLGPRTIPGTLVLDRDGRVAATVVGPLPSALTLSELVAQVATEGPDG